MHARYVIMIKLVTDICTSHVQVHLIKWIICLKSCHVGLCLSVILKILHICPYNGIMSMSKVGEGSSSIMQ